MSIYPPAVTAQELYEASDVQKHKVGTVAVFDTANGLVQAMYCRNAFTTSMAAGFPVGAAAGALVHTAQVAANANFQGGRVLGGLAASMANSASGGYAWVILRGPQTNAFIANAATGSAATALLLGVNSSAQLITVATSDNGVAMLRSTSTNMVSGTAHGNIVDWLWR